MISQIDWSSDTTEIILNPRLPPVEQLQAHKLIKATPTLSGHLWLSTSGSSGFIKWAALSKKAILASAEAVNTHLKSTQNDVWLNPLPVFHVGGLGILARSFLSGALSVDYRSLHGDKWNVHSFHKALCDCKATLTALVPAQAYDLVLHRLKAPKSLRGVIIGGGALSEALYLKAAELGWPLLPSYGLTETSSQVATARIEDLSDTAMPAMHLLPHLEVSINDRGFICIKGPATLTGYAVRTDSGPQFFDPKREGWFHTEDRGEIAEGRLRMLGRDSNFVKIGGESVDVTRLEKILEACKLESHCDVEVVLLAVPHPRLGHVIALATTSTEEAVHLVVESFNQRVLPFEKVRSVHIVSLIPRTPMNKVLKPELLQRILQG